MKSTKLNALNYHTHVCLETRESMLNYIHTFVYS